jgi:protein-disulfide isomerase
VPADPTAVRSKRAAARRRIEEKRAAEAAARAAAERRRRTRVGGVTAAVVVLVAVVVAVVVQTGRTTTSAEAAVPANTVDDGTTVVVGSADAPVTVDVYEDFQCPVCRTFEEAAGPTLAQLVGDGTVQVHYHGMAFLDTSANDDYSTRALPAAAAVVDTAGPDSFQAFHDLLFAHQPAEGGDGLTDDRLVELAAQAGATGDAVEQQIRDLTYGDWVETVTDRASRDGVTGTPTVLVDGEPLEELSADALSAAVTAAAAR